MIERKKNEVDTKTLLGYDFKVALGQEEHLQYLQLTHADKAPSYATVFK